MNCPECNAPIKDGHKFCGKCGYRLENPPDETAGQNAVEEVVSAADEKAMELLIKGVDLHFAGNLKGALKLFKKAEKIAPHRPDVHENIGNIYRDMPDFRKAIEYYNRSIEIDPENGSAYANRAVTHFESGQTGKALQDFNRALELEPTNPEALFSRASMFIDGGHLDAAMKDLDLLIQVEPNFAQAYLSRGFIHQQQDKYPQAETDYLKAIELSDDPDIIQDARSLLEQLR